MDKPAMLSSLQAGAGKHEDAARVSKSPAADMYTMPAQSELTHLCTTTAIAAGGAEIDQLILRWHIDCRRLAKNHQTTANIRQTIACTCYFAVTCAASALDAPGSLSLRCDCAPAKAQTMPSCSALRQQQQACE
jgi:hypothetical protein